MSFEAISWACRQTVGKSSIKFVLIALANHADAQGFAWPSISSICQTTEQDRKTVIFALDALRKTGLLIDTGDKKGATKQVPMYRLSLSDSTVSSAVKPTLKRDSTESGTVPEKRASSAVSPRRQYQKRDTEPSITHKEPSSKYIRPDDVEEKLWADFMTIRKAKKAPITDTAVAGIRRECGKAGIEFREAVAMCCERGWQTFKADWVKDRFTKPSAAPLASKNYREGVTEDGRIH